MIIKLNAGEAFTLGAVGRYFRVLKADGAVKVRAYAKGAEIYKGELTQGLSVDFANREDYPRPFDSIEVTSDIAQTVTVHAELARMDDNRTDGVVVSQVGVGQLSNSEVTVTTSETLLAPANAKRRRLTIQPDAKVYVGGSGVTTSTGLVIEAGGVGEFEVSAEFYALTDTLTANVRIMQEVNL